MKILNYNSELSLYINKCCQLLFKINHRNVFYKYQNTWFIL